MKTNKIIRVLLISILMIVTVSGSCRKAVYAAGDAKVMQAIVDDEKVKAYIRGVSSGNEATYQIGNIAADAPVSYQITEDSANMRTLIMVDNSLSIPQNSRPAIKEGIKSIIDAHGENELFRLATFSEDVGYLSDQYSSDYTALKNVADSIEHVDQETYLTDVLFDVVDELNSEDYPGYTRIIVFSDGVDNKPIGVTREELNKKLEETPYPIYTVGFSTGKNDSELENMFAISRLTGCEYVLVDKEQSADVASVTSMDNSIAVYEASIPDDAKTGGRQSSKLTLSDGTEIVFPVEMPFSIKQAEPETIEDETTSEEESYEEEEEDDDEEEEEEAMLFGLPLNIAIAVIAGAVLLVIIIILVLIVVSRSRKRKKTAPAAEPPREVYERTEIMGAAPRRKEGNTVYMTPDGDEGKIKRYRFTLTDAADTARSFRCELINEIKIGRQSDNNIVLSDDTAVHGHHSVVRIVNDSFQYTDLKEVKNHSSVDNVALKPGIPHLIVTNSRITIGRHTYVVSITQE